MFNLLNFQWHKSNVYTFKQALEILGVVENVLPIDTSNTHIDYTSLSDKWYKQPASAQQKKSLLFPDIFQSGYNKDGKKLPSLHTFHRSIREIINFFAIKGIFTSILHLLLTCFLLGIF